MADLVPARPSVNCRRNSRAANGLDNMVRLGEIADGDTCWFDNVLVFADCRAGRARMLAGRIHMLEADAFAYNLMLAAVVVGVAVVVVDVAVVAV